MFVSQVEMSLREDDQVLMISDSLRVESDVMVSDMPLVCEFPNDIFEFPPKQEVEFSIDLLPGTRFVLMAPNRMSSSELGKLKK